MVVINWNVGVQVARCYVYSDLSCHNNDKDFRAATELDTMWRFYSREFYHGAGYIPTQ